MNKFGYTRKSRMGSQESNPNPFFTPVTDTAERLSLLEDALRDRAALTLWTKGKDHLLTGAHLTRMSAQALEVEASTVEEMKIFVEKLQANPDGCYVNYAVKLGSVFCLADLLSAPTDVKKKSIVLAFPKEFFKVQRRQGIRLPLKPPYSLFVEFKLPGDFEVTKKKINDISIGGLAFFVPPEEAAQYVVGEKIRKMSFVVRNKAITATGEVRHTRLIKKEQGTQLLVGVQFENLPAKETGLIDKFVMEETQSQFTALVGKR